MSETAEYFHNKMLEVIDDKYQKTIGFPTYDITAAVAAALELQSADIDSAVAKADIDKLSGEELEKFISQRKNIVRKSAVNAFGKLLITVIRETNLDSGSLFETEQGIQFKTTETAELAVGENYIFAEAVQAGSSGNVPADTVCRIPVTIAGVIAVNNPEPMTGGYDAESDSELRARYYKAIRNPVTAGNKYQYEQWALEVDGCGGAKVFPLANGANTVEICIVGTGGTAPSQDLIERVQNYIDPNSSGTGDGTAPIGAYCTVIGAEILPIDVSADISMHTETQPEIIMENIKKAITSYLEEIAFGVSMLSYAKIGSIIMNVDGVDDYSQLLLNGGVVNINIGERQLPLAGELNFTYV